MGQRSGWRTRSNPGAAERANRSGCDFPLARIGPGNGERAGRYYQELAQRRYRRLHGDDTGICHGQDRDDGLGLRDRVECGSCREVCPRVRRQGLFAQGVTRALRRS